MKKLCLFVLPLIIYCGSGPGAVLENPASPALLGKHVKALVHDGQFRNYKNLNELNRAARYIKGEIEKNGFHCDYQPFMVNGKEYKNIVCSLEPRSDNLFVVGAHYDVCGEQEGADDNASGVAGLIELSRMLSLQRDSMKVNIELVAYTLEEPPFFGTHYMGSYIHAKSLKDRDADLRGMLCLEMIGYFSDEEIQDYPPVFSWFYPRKGNFIAVVSDFGSAWLSRMYESVTESTTGMQVEKLAAPSAVGGVDFSDHRNYWEFGYDAVMITDTAFFRNKNYHRTSDTAETLDFNRMASVVNGVASMLLSCDMRK